jgi:hypothetical protein
VPEWSQVTRSHLQHHRVGQQLALVDYRPHLCHDPVNQQSRCKRGIQGTFSPCSDSLFIAARTKSPAAMCATPKDSEIREANVPLPTPGGPRNTHRMLSDAVEQNRGEPAVSSAMTRFNGYDSMVLVSVWMGTADWSTYTVLWAGADPYDCRGSIHSVASSWVPSLVNSQSRGAASTASLGYRASSPSRGVQGVAYPRVRRIACPSQYIDVLQCWSFSGLRPLDDVTPKSRAPTKEVLAGLQVCEQISARLSRKSEVHSCVS